tara:strand:+ start:311 stop:499 length:189 start_codon:yes stop_codon:yes gene_type:complete
VGIEKKEIERLNHTIEELREELEILQEAVGILMGAVMEDSDEGEEIEILDRKLMAFGPRMGM